MTPVIMPKVPKTIPLLIIQNIPVRSVVCSINYTTRFQLFNLEKSTFDALLDSPMIYNMHPLSSKLPYYLNQSNIYEENFSTRFALVFISINLFTYYFFKNDGCFISPDILDKKSMLIERFTYVMKNKLHSP